MKKRLLSILLMCCMVLTLLPTTAFATGGAEEPPVCTCETACTAESMNAGCAVCGAAGASVESCAKYAAPVNGQDNKPYSTQSFLAENLVDPMIRIHLSPDGGGYYSILNGTWTAADFFQPGKAPKGAKITVVTPPTSPSIPVSVKVDSDGTLSCTKAETTTEPALKAETYTVTITSDDYAPITAPLTVRQYFDAGFEGPIRFNDKLLYGDTYTYTCRVNNPGTNGVWSALIQNPDVFEIYQETTDITSEPGKSIYTVQIRAIKASARVTWIDFQYLSDTTIASSKDSSTVITGGAVSTRPLTVTAGSATITEGDTLPTDLVTCTGLLDSEGRKDDRDTVLDNALSYKLLDANNTEIAADTARNTPGTYTVVPAAALKSGWEERYALNRVNGTLTVEDKVEEQFSLTPGGRYYFDLSAMNIPGTANSNLPDSTLHYVPFTYVGTVNAYKLTSEMATTEAYAQQNKYAHSLFVADYAVTYTISWGGLNDEGLIFGKDYVAGGVGYTLRAPSVGSGHTGSGDIERGTPQSNEWDAVLDKNSGYIKNWNGIYSWGQDTTRYNSPLRAARGYSSARYWYYINAATSSPSVGFRPVLEVPNPGTLGADGLKAVTLNLGGGKLGGSSDAIHIIVKNGSTFTAPASDGMTRPDGVSAGTPMWWVDESLNFYKPGDTVPADVSELYAFYGGLGLFLDRGNGEVEVTPDNYTDIFGDGTASFVLPKGSSLTELEKFSYDLTFKDILGIYSTGKIEKYSSVFPNLKLKNADLTSVRLSEKYIGYESPLFITLDGKNTVGSLNGISMSKDTLSILGDGSLTLNSALTLERYTQYGGGSVTMTNGLTASYLSIDSGSLTVTDDPQAITLRDQAISDLYMGDGVRLFTGSSAQDAAEAVIPQLSAEMQEVYQRYLAEDNTLTYEELVALSNALRERFNAIFRQLPGKTYVRITGAWDVTYQPGTDGTGSAVTDIKFYNDILTLRSKLFTRTGYTQTGWATVDGGEKVYAFGGIYTTNAALTLYPVWQMDTYAITYDLNGGTAEGNPDTYTVETDAFTLKNPTRPGYTFTGWSGTGLTGEDNLTVTIPKGSTGDRSYTAHWRYNGGGGSGYSYYTIKATAGAGGSISPSGNVSVREGRDQTFTITPDKGYAVANVKIDGKSIGAVKSYTFENVRRTHTIEVIFMKANGNPQTGVFVDVATGSYYEDAVDWAVENGITKGTDDTHFSPDGICTRAQAVTFLWRAAGSPAPRSRTMPFTDVPVGSYYYDAVLWAVENGITKGTSDTTFSPNMTCSRAQIVAFLWRSEKSPAAGTANPFADVKSTAYYAGAVLWAVKEDITKGTTNTTFSPDADCTRAQIVTFLWRCKK